MTAASQVHSAAACALSQSQAGVLWSLWPTARSHLAAQSRAHAGEAHGLLWAAQLLSNGCYGPAELRTLALLVPAMSRGRANKEACRCIEKPPGFDHTHALGMRVVINRVALRCRAGPCSLQLSCKGALSCCCSKLRPAASAHGRTAAAQLCWKQGLGIPRHCCG